MNRSIKVLTYKQLEQEYIEMAKDNGFVQFWTDFIEFCSINLIGNYIKLITCLKSLNQKLSRTLLIIYLGGIFL